MIDPLAENLWHLLTTNPWATLAAIGQVCGRHERGYVTLGQALSQSLYWNTMWHAHELKNLARIRRQYIRATKIILKYGDL